MAEMEVTGHATLGGDDDFVISAGPFPPSKDAFFFYGLAQASVPFHGSTLCVGGVLARKRATLQTVGYNVNDGFYLYGQSEMEQDGLLPGMQVFGQFVARSSDPHLPPMLSEGIAFTVGP